MNWRERLGVVLRGHDTAADPTAEGYDEAIFAVEGILPVPVPVGNPAPSVGGMLNNRVLVRWEYDLDCLPFKVRATDGLTGYQDYGAFIRLARVLTRKRLWLYETRLAADTGGVWLPRAGEHDPTAAGANTFWSDHLASPVEVVLDGEARPERAAGGLVTLSFVLKKRGVDYAP